MKYIFFLLIFLLIDLSQGGEFSTTIALPPIELQTGDRTIFEGFQSVYEANPRFVDKNQARKLFVMKQGQKFDLSKLGPGTAIFFVSDEKGERKGFGISNGRFEGRESAGSIIDGTYDHKAELGKYPWPKDAKGEYLPGSILVKSNGPHGQIHKALNLSTLSKDQGVLSGHVIVGFDGKARIGYTSIVNDWNGNRNSSKISQKDKRAMKAEFRAKFHEVIEESFEGRNIEAVAKSAPILEKEVLNSNSLSFYPEYRPKEQLIIDDGKTWVEMHLLKKKKEHLIPYMLEPEIHISHMVQNGDWELLHDVSKHSTSEGVLKQILTLHKFESSPKVKNKLMSVIETYPKGGISRLLVEMESVLEGPLTFDDLLTYKPDLDHLVDHVISGNSNIGPRIFSHPLIGPSRLSEAQTSKLYKYYSRLGPVYQNWLKDVYPQIFNDERYMSLVENFKKDKSTTSATPKKSNCVSGEIFKKLKSILRH